MSYATVQTALQTTLRTLPALASQPEAVVLASSAVLDSGLTPGVILYPGVFDSGDNTGFEIERTWQVAITLFVRYMDEVDAFTAFIKFRDDVVELLDATAVMDAGGLVTFHRVWAAEDVQEVYDTQGGGPFFLMQRLLAEITEVIVL